MLNNFRYGVYGHRRSYAPKCRTVYDTITESACTTVTEQVIRIPDNINNFNTLLRPTFINVKHQTSFVCINKTKDYQLRKNAS